MHFVRKQGGCLLSKLCYVFWVISQEAMEKAIKNKVAKAVVPAIDVMFQAVRCQLRLLCSFVLVCYSGSCFFC